MVKYWLAILCIVIFLYFHSLITRTSRIVFCDVGQGSATFITTGTLQILIDTGPDMRSLACIGRHMPFFDHTIEFIVLSHDQQDHVGALPMLIKKYKVGHMIGPPEMLGKHTGVPFTAVESIVQFAIGSIDFSIIKASQSSVNINESANVVTIRSRHHVVFLTSDINGFELQRLIPSDATLLSVPHHGSRYGLYPDSLGSAHPTYAVISVGKKNSYGHPAQEVLDILKAKKIQVWRTDQQGELAIDL